MGIFEPGQPDLSSHPLAYPSVTAMMNVNLTVNERGQIWILHDKQFPCVLNWAEYDGDMRTLSLMSHDGLPLELGMKIQTIIHNKILNTPEICTVLLHEGELADFYVIPLIIRDSGLTGRAGN